MSQHDLDIANQSASNARADINNALQALGSLNSGSSSPVTTYANMLWYDTANNTLKMRSEANADWITLGILNQTTLSFAPSNAVPTGAVNAFAMGTTPAGWLSCDGGAVSRTDYGTLFSAIGTTYGVGDGSTTFNLPDLRGEFVRGVDDGRGVDSGRTLGSNQGDAFQGHYHKLTSEDGTQVDIGNVTMGSGGSGRDVNEGTADAVREALTDGTNGAPRTASETRPRNIALLYCIKY